MIDARVLGADSMRKAARELRRIERLHLTREVRGAVKSTVDDLYPRLMRASVVAHLPSGYAPDVLKGVRVTTRLRTGGGHVNAQITVWARGDAEHRDLAALDKGLLRHPVFGRYRWATRGGKRTARPSPWVAQTIPAGTFTRPFTAVETPLVARTEAAVSRLADRFNRGGAGL